MCSRSPYALSTRKPFLASAHRPQNRQRGMSLSQRHDKHVASMCDSAENMSSGLAANTMWRVGGRGKRGCPGGFEAYPTLDSQAGRSWLVQCGCTRPRGTGYLCVRDSASTPLPPVSKPIRAHACVNERLHVRGRVHVSVRTYVFVYVCLRHESPHRYYR